LTVDEKRCNAGVWVHDSRKESTVDDEDHGSERSWRRITVPLTSMASEADILEARRLLVIHRPRTAVRQVCTGCGKAWPCLDTLYALAVTDAKPESTDPDSQP
jgi:hypothetical protein